jgi:hypothetical protein
VAIAIRGGSVADVWFAESFNSTFEFALTGSMQELPKEHGLPLDNRSPRRKSYWMQRSG